MNDKYDSSRALTRPLTIALACFVGALVASPKPAFGFAYTTDEQRCRDAVASSAVKLAVAAARTFNKCHQARSSGSLPGSTDCNDATAADTRGHIARAVAKAQSAIPGRCTGVDPVTVKYGACPAPCSTAVPSVSTADDVADCITCLVVDGTEILSGVGQAAPTPPLGGTDLACHRDLGKAATKYFRSILRERRRCQKRAEAGGADTTDSCVDSDPRGKIFKTETAAAALIERRCASADLAAVGSCDTASAQALRDCILDNADLRASEAFAAMYGFGDFVVTTTTTTTTTTLAPQDPSCPEFSELVLYGRAGIECVDNSDCVVGACDQQTGRCRTATDLDTGWTGVSHDSDISDVAVVRAKLRCSGPFDSQASEPCGQCTVTGVDPSLRSCRCVSDNRAICDEPFSADADDCGGGLCACYLGPPLPLSSGNTPVCVVNRLREDIRGTANVDLGSTESQIRLGSVVYLGEGLTGPCPYCTGDPIAGDGVRGGVCMLGEDAGATCDTDAINRTFPAPGGDGSSLDCFPSVGKNITGTGLKISFDQTTGTAEPITASIPCFFNNFLCHCMVCTGDTTLACDSDAVCAAAGAGTCTVFGNGANPKTNGCTGDFQCVDQGGEEGRCNQGPDERFCDGVTTAEGRGFVACNSNADCANSSCDTVPCGDCTIVERRRCFLDTIEATGTPSPSAPITVGTFCIPPTSNAGVNAVAGLPGPGRLANQATSTLFCASDPLVEYVPGTGGCP